MMREAGAKFQRRELKECIRMTSVSCTSEPQVKLPFIILQNCFSFFQANAALALEQGDLTTFTDLINTKDVESGSREARHWINSSIGEARGSLVEMAINRGRTDFLDVLLRAGARWCFSFVLTGNQGIPRLDMVGEMSGLAPGHLAVEKGSAMLTLLLSHRDSWDVNIRCPSNWRCFKDHT